jgi:hypothetical protein
MVRRSLARGLRCKSPPEVHVGHGRCDLSVIIVIVPGGLQMRSAPGSGVSYQFERARRLVFLFFRLATFVDCFIHF